jgi:anti-sigma B factor antagonist
LSTTEDRLNRMATDAGSSNGPVPQDASSSGKAARAVVVALLGDLDMLTAASARSQVQDGLAGRPALLTVDLSKVTFLASAGLSVLMYAHAEAQHAGVQLSLTGVENNRVVGRVLEVTGMMAMFDFDT